MILQLTPVPLQFFDAVNETGREGGMARRAREEAPGEDREVPGRRRRAGEFSVVAKFCADFLLNLQLTPAVPPVL